MPLGLSNFEDDSQFIYGAFQPKTSNQNFLDFYRNNANNTYNWGYMGHLGNMVKSGQTPNTSFLQYMDTMYDPWQEFRKMSPTQRGENQSRYAPSTYFNLPRV